MQLSSGKGAFAQGLCFDKMVWVFTVCSAVGVVAEVLFCFVFTGCIQSRKGLIYGPFNQIYGFGAVLLLLVLYRCREKSNLAVFAAGAVAGGVFEYLCSVGQELLLGTVSWDYTSMWYSVGGRTNLLYMCLFGGLGVLLVRLLYPAISRRVERFPPKRGSLVTRGLLVFMVANLLLSGLAVNRWVERQTGVAQRSGIDAVLDRYYPDEMLSVVYPSMTVRETA